MDLEAAFNKFEDEFLKFERISAPRHERPDVAAFLLLQAIVPGTGDMISAAEHDQIWLGVDIEELARAATEDEVLELVRCGVMLEDGSLSMFV